MQEFERLIGEWHGEGEIAMEAARQGRPSEEGCPGTGQQAAARWPVLSRPAAAPATAAGGPDRTGPRQPTGGAALS